VQDGKVSTDPKDIIYLSAEDEDSNLIAQANAPVSKDGAFANDIVKARLEGDFPQVAPDQLHYMDVAPNQIASIAASLIPFLEHDDANRALMGSNMMRQAVPLMKPAAPIVGTGLEQSVAEDSRILMRAEADGTIEFVDANEIHIKYTMDEMDELVSFEDAVNVLEIPKFRQNEPGHLYEFEAPCSERVMSCMRAKYWWTVTPLTKGSWRWDRTCA
jgi:DNA-directed RNA polymerase subunit beta